MELRSTLAIAALLTASIAAAQTTSDLVFFTDDGTRFTLVVDGDVKNEAPATRVVAAGIRTESPMVIVRFEDASIPQIRKPGYFPLGMEYTVMITTNKKGERVLRPTGEAELGTAVKNEPGPSMPSTFVEDAPVSTHTITTTDHNSIMTGAAPGTVTTVTVVEEVDDTNGENLNLNMGVNGMGVNMNINVNEGMGATGTTTTTTRTTTHTTTSTTGTTTQPVVTTPATTTVIPVKEPEVYHMPGYTGPIGCAWPMSQTEYDDAKKSIESKSFEETKMTTAKQIGRDRCFTVDQVKGIMGGFSFEDTRLEFAKYAYDRTYDIGNYYKVNDAFTFESSIDELNKYTQSR